MLPPQSTSFKYNWYVVTMTNPYQINDNWCRHIPLLHRVLADPSQIMAFPNVTSLFSLEETCAVWETLHYLLRDLLGWSDPGRGLAWWYSVGKPIVDSPLLQVVQELWDQDHQLDYYAAWAWTSGTDLLARENVSPQNFARDTCCHDADWWATFLRRPVPSRYNPYYGGCNPLHLGHSEWFGDEDSELKNPQIYVDAGQRRAMLVVGDLGSWKRDLRWAAEQLPPIGDRSWHVELFDRQTGYLGLFRRSRETGRWFQGKHSVHIKGQSAPSHP